MLLGEQEIVRDASNSFFLCSLAVPKMSPHTFLRENPIIEKRLNKSVAGCIYLCTYLRYYFCFYNVVNIVILFYLVFILSLTHWFFFTYSGGYFRVVGNCAIFTANVAQSAGGAEYSKRNTRPLYQLSTVRTSQTAGLDAQPPHY